MYIASPMAVVHRCTHCRRHGQRLLNYPLSGARTHRNCQVAPTRKQAFDEMRFGLSPFNLPPDWKPVATPLIPTRYAYGYQYARYVYHGKQLVRRVDQKGNQSWYECR